MLVAITRDVSPTINNCELSFHKRELIDLTTAVSQHRAYQDCLARLGLRLVPLPADPDCPDAVFVEDTAVVVDEVAVIARMGAPSRRPEIRAVAEALSEFRSIEWMTEPATLDGGDVMRIGRTLYVGASARTNLAGADQLQDILRPFDYRVVRVGVAGCLHLKSGCSFVGRDAILINRNWADAGKFGAFELIDVAPEEPAAANALLVEDTAILPASFPKTAEMLSERGFRIRTVDVSELQKAEGGVTCKSIIFEDRG
jgi:dimethylargininase